MAAFNSWISALRPRTLFLAIAAALCGSGIAYSVGKFNIPVCIFSLLTATILQLLSNLANDLGDYQHGTDITGERVGPKRTVQSGTITPKQMKKAIVITIGMAIFSGLILIYEAAQFLSLYVILFFLLLGLGAIFAAIKYTAGKNPYGYKGLGDIFCFIFFGPVPVVGTYFLHTHEMDFRAWLPGIGLGLCAVAVLNINNMRDLENDRKSGKITMAVRLGIKKAKLYHTFLTFGAIACFLSYSLLYSSQWYEFLYTMVFLLFVNILIKIFRTKENKALDPYLRYTSISSFLLVLAFIICINS